MPLEDITDFANQFWSQPAQRFDAAAEVENERDENQEERTGVEEGQETAALPVPPESVPADDWETW